MTPSRTIPVTVPRDAHVTVVPPPLPLPEKPAPEAESVIADGVIGESVTSTHEVHDREVYCSLSLFTSRPDAVTLHDAPPASAGVSALS